MLQALTTTGKLVIPAILSRHKMQYLRKNGPYYCPECRMKVIFRAGTKVIPHFAHQQSLNCSKNGGESLYHMKGKLQIYQNMRITPIWLIGANDFKRIGKQKIKVNSFMMETLQKFSAHTSTQLLYYCPETHKFFKANDLHLTTNQYAITQLIYYKTHQI